MIGSRRGSTRRALAGSLDQGLRVMALHCTECGFVNDEGANYCQRCGALLARAESVRASR